MQFFTLFLAKYIQIVYEIYNISEKYHKNEKNKVKISIIFQPWWTPSGWPSRWSPGPSSWFGGLNIVNYYIIYQNLSKLIAFELFMYKIWN